MRDPQMMDCPNRKRLGSRAGPQLPYKQHRSKTSWVFHPFNLEVQ